MLLIYVPGERERVLKAPSPNICGEADIAEANKHWVLGRDSW